MDAGGELDRAGRRRDREDDGVDFDAELAAFGDEEFQSTEEETPAEPAGADEEVAPDDGEEDKKKDRPDGLAEFE